MGWGEGSKGGVRGGWVGQHAVLPEHRGAFHTPTSRVLTHPRGPTPVKMKKKKGKKKGGTPGKQAAAA